ncbi:MAG: hypothetical protein J0H74_20975 [Chitinophagaceae bacterium]|nr:hypothetical protein [Chitinophagaceae bacterium]
MALKDIYPWYARQRASVKATLVFFSTLLLVFLFFELILLGVNGLSGKVMDPIYQSENILNDGVIKLKKPAVLTSAYFTVFKTQYEIMKLRKEHHLSLAILFFRNYYSVLILTMFISCIGGVTLFVMINKGWTNAGITLQSFFLSLVCATTYLGFFPLVFKQQDNFSENMQYYESYTKAQLGIYHQLVSLQNPKFQPLSDSLKISGNPLDSANYRLVDSMIARNGVILNELTNYVFSIDAKQVKGIGDVKQMIDNALSSSRDSTRSN